MLIHKGTLPFEFLIYGGHRWLKNLLDVFKSEVHVLRAEKVMMRHMCSLMAIALRIYDLLMPQFASIFGNVVASHSKLMFSSVQSIR